MARALLFALLLARSRASVMVHYFGRASCNANTALSQYSDPNTVKAVTACIAAAPGTAALYVDRVDEGCTVRTYTDASCTTNLGLSITVGTCYYKDDATIGSWRAVCGASAGAAPASSESTVTLSLMATPAVGYETALEASTNDPVLSSGMDLGHVLTSVETVTPTMTASPPTDVAPVPTMMPSAGGNGTNWTNGTFTQSKAGPSGSPGLQGTGSGGMGISGAGAKGEWRREAVKCLGVIGVAAGVGGCLVELL